MHPLSPTLPFSFMDFADTRIRLMSYLRPQWRLLAAAVAFFLLSSAVEPVVPALFKKLIDSGFQEDSNTRSG